MKQWSPKIGTHKFGNSCMGPSDQQVFPFFRVPFLISLQSSSSESSYSGCSHSHTPRLASTHAAASVACPPTLDHTILLSSPLHPHNPIHLLCFYINSHQINHESTTHPNSSLGGTRFDPKLSSVREPRTTFFSFFVHYRGKINIYYTKHLYFF
jgi:hypothetical protein